MKRNQTILLGVLALLAIATFFVLREPGEQSLASSAGEPLVKYDSASVDKLHITANNTTVTLEKKGGKWMVTSPFNYPADEAGVTLAVGKGKEMKVTALVSSNPSKQNLYAVDSAGTLVHVYANNTDVATFRIGKPASSWTETYARKEGSNDVYTVDGTLGTTFVKPVNDWRDKTIFKADQGNVRDVKFRFAGKGKDTTFTLSRVDSVTWLVDNEPANSSSVTGFLSSLANYQTDEFVDAEATTAKDLTATIEAQGVQLRFYKRPDNKYDVQSSASPQWFTVQEWKANQLLKRKKDFAASPSK